MSVQACAEIVRKGDPERFQSVMATGPVNRARLFPIYAFNVEVARAPWVTEEPLIAEMRLQWWADVLDEIASSHPVRKHEVATPLAEILTPEAIAPLLGLVEARRRDCGTEPMGSWEEAREYVGLTAGNLMAAAGAVTGCAECLDALRAYGTSTGMATYLLAQPVMAARGRHVMAVPERAPQIAELAGNELEISGRLARSLPRLAAPAARAAWLARRRLRAIAANPACRHVGGPEISEFVKRGSLLVRALAGRP